ncbi:MAG: Anaerobic dehydrogenase typically selenocysteine-containing-like protein, partial [Bacteroidetes bacterium]|nr:Anaerobic dehydrogenase typically selenocysteine-containing-like protein [Bacteroidota bacterium]
RRIGASESRAVSLDEATHVIAEAIRSSSAEEYVAVLDLQPGRSISRIYRQLLAQLPHGSYVLGPVVEDATLAMCARMSGTDEHSLGYDLENARTIVSFGAPLFDGWGTPGRMMRLAEGRRKKGQPTIHQIETRQSRTALQADSWIPIKPGSEGQFALGLAHVLVQERLCNVGRVRALAPDFSGHGADSFESLLARFTPEHVSFVTGVSVDRIQSVARSIAANAPTIVLGAGDPAGGPMHREDDFAIASLNFLLGSVGQRGGIVARRTALAAEESDWLPVSRLNEIPDHSIRVLLLDSAESGHAIPWSLVERKLADEKALVVSFSPYVAGLSRHAEIIIPSPAFLESWQDLPTPSHAPVASLGLSAPFLNPRPESVEPLEALKKIASALGVTIEAQASAYPDLLKARVQALYESGTGSVFTPSDRKTIPLKEMGSAEALWGALAEGGCWIGDTTNPSGPSRFTFFERSGITPQQINALANGGAESGLAHAPDSAVALMPFGWRGAAGSAQVSPLMSKLYQESGLRMLSNHALINPETGKARGIKENETATVETPAGLFQVIVRFDASVMPDVLHVAIGPDGATINSGNTGDASDLLSMCLAEDGRSWRVTAARVSSRTV